jgi:hypothetical protein
MYLTETDQHWSVALRGVCFLTGELRDDLRQDRVDRLHMISPTDNGDYREVFIEKPHHCAVTPTGIDVESRWPWIAKYGGDSWNVGMLCDDIQETELFRQRSSEGVYRWCMEGPRRHRIFQRIHRAS